MSVIFNATGEAAKRTTNVVAGSSNYTCTFYVKFTSTPGVVPDYQTAFVTVNGVGTYTQFAGLYRYDDTMLYLQVDNGSGPSATSGYAMAEDVWFRVAYVRVGNTQRFYVNGALIDEVTVNMTLTSLTETWIGDDTFSSSGVEIAYFREWSSSTTLTGLNAEWLSPIVVDETALVTDTPLVSDLLDDSGNSNDWTAVGSLTFDATKPAFPANATRAGATAIASLPFSGTQDVWSEGLAYQVWYSYTAGASEDVIGFWAYCDE